MALNATKAELELSHEAAERKQAQIHSVQKAQTKRWLKNEYKVALAAAVEERLEKVCDEASLLDVVCDLPAEQRRTHWELENDKQGSDVKRCGAVGLSRCKAFVEEHAEALARAALDGRGWASCAKIARECEPEPLDDDGEVEAEPSRADDKVEATKEEL